MSRIPTVGDVLRIIAAIPRPDRDRSEVREFVCTLPRDQNTPATVEQMSAAEGLT